MNSQTRADLVGRSADPNAPLDERIIAIARILSGMERRLDAILRGVDPPAMHVPGVTALRSIAAVLAKIARQTLPYIGNNDAPADWRYGDVPPPPDDETER